MAETFPEVTDLAGVHRKHCEAYVSYIAENGRFVRKVHQQRDYRDGEGLDLRDGIGVHRHHPRKGGKGDSQRGRRHGAVEPDIIRFSKSYDELWQKYLLFLAFDIATEKSSEEQVVGGFPNGYLVMMLVGARLRHISTTKWGTRQYLACKMYKENVM